MRVFSLIQIWLQRFSCLIILFSASYSFGAENQVSYSSNLQVTETLTVVRGIGNYPPLEMVKDGQLTGLHIDMIKHAAHQLGIEIEFISLPWTRAIKEFSAGNVDAISYLGYTPERSEIAYYHDDNVLSDTKWVFLALEERAHEFKYDRTLSGLENSVIGVQKGYSHGKYFDSMKHLKRDVVTHEFDIETMLKEKRHDLAMMSYQEFLGFKERGDFKGIVALFPEIDSDPQYIVFSRAQDESGRLKRISQLFADQMRLFKSSRDYDVLLKSYDFYRYQ